MNHDHSNGMGKHMLMMLICCLVPIALIAAVSMFGLSLGALTPLIPYALALMCPLMMIFMMRGMMHEQGPADPHAHHTNAPRAADAAPEALPAPNAPTASPRGKANAGSTQERCH